MIDLKNSHSLRSLPERWDRLLALASRLFVWGLIFTILYILRSFSLLLFLTFVFSYIQGHAIVRLKSRISNRVARVVIVAVIFLGILIGIASYIGPHFRVQAELVAARYTDYLKAFDRELIGLSLRYPIFEKLTPEIPELTGMLGTDGKFTRWTPDASPTAALLQKGFGIGGSEEEQIDIKKAVETVRGISAQVLGAISAFLLSLLFSFLILLDFPKLSESVRSLEQTKLGFIYSEVAGSVYHFAGVLGRALEAQLFIALLNTILTAIGLQLLGLRDQMAFLSIIVFLCSFIPVAGVFISSVPICLLGLQSGGVYIMFWAVGLILLIHFIETYFLNPRIYGHHLHINPVLVLIILTVGGKLFGVWGLVLGVPVCSYIFGHAIVKPGNCPITPGNPKS